MNFISNFYNLLLNYLIYLSRSQQENTADLTHSKMTKSFKVMEYFKIYLCYLISTAYTTYVYSYKQGGGKILVKS